MMQEKFRTRFQELTDSFKEIQFITDGFGFKVSKDGKWQKWATSAENLIRAVFSDNSPHYINFKDQYSQCKRDSLNVEALESIFHSAKEDFEGGYIFNVELRISGEVFGDFIALSRQALSEGQKDVAAVLACAALEDALKRYAEINGLAVDDKTMQDVVNALKSAGLVAGAQKSLLDAMPRIRNFAMHAEWSKISEPDVSSVLGFVEQFLLTKFV
ncbi:DUF4145 domain-containing protein [Methylomonas sp. MED-D]|uniref:DUF4145 domain-containing protein n=1 Tax=Methylomonas sp. MED-D TaxID=3418768 RepID=UPI003D00AA37